MEFVVALLVLAAALAALAIPLYRAHAQPALVSASTLDDLLAQRDGVYATLRDLELDRQLGKLDEADYGAIHEKYMVQAAAILRELDALQGEGSTAEASAEIERQVSALRKTHATAARGQTAAKHKDARARECPNCGKPYLRGDKFCARCGHALP